MCLTYVVTLVTSNGYLFEGVYKDWGGEAVRANADVRERKMVSC